MTDYVWYASYGSNISTNRFLCYILGGQAIGAKTCEIGCKNKDLPIKYDNIEIYKIQYFAKKSFRWQNKGVAFLDGTNSDVPTLGRMYLITREQFEDVIKQENHLSVENDLQIDFQEVQRLGSKIIIPESWYGRILYLGSKDHYPIFTFTNVDCLEAEIISYPSKAYLQMIGRGLIENYNLNIHELVNYFIIKPGVMEYYSTESLKKIFNVLYITENKGNYDGR